jgi:hydroxymethylpyrimidine/phosphomethylpyrimidine kinase
MSSNMKRTVVSAMTIAGSDSGGGAGIQADLKTFAAYEVYGTSVLTAITAQNTVGVTGIHDIPSDLISEQIRCVMDDIGADAIKTGMLSTSSIVRTVSQELDKYDVQNLVVDPVMVAKSGDSLLQEEAIEAVKNLMIPLATVVTPNIPEAEVLTGMTIMSEQDMKTAAGILVHMGAKSVVVKGGHLDGPASDLFYDGSTYEVFTVDRIDTVNTHGLAKGYGIRDSVAEAKLYITESIRKSFAVGSGHGPLNHFHKFWQ